MKNNIYCVFGITISIASILMVFPNMKNIDSMDFYDSLNEEQKTIYSDIIRERVNIYMKGTILGLIISLLYYFNANDKYKICKSLSIFGFINNAVYYFSPKKPSITYSLTTKEQLDKWQNIGVKMRNRWKKSLIAGLIGYYIIFYSLK